MLYCYCLAIDLVDDEALINEYELYHRQVWPEILQSIRDAGIGNMQIYRAGNRLFMIIESTEPVDFERKAAMDSANQKVQEWEKLMDRLQQRLPFAATGGKWAMMNKIFELNQ